MLKIQHTAEKQGHHERTTESIIHDVKESSYFTLTLMVFISQLFQTHWLCDIPHRPGWHRLHAWVESYSILCLFYHDTLLQTSRQSDLSGTERYGKHTTQSWLPTADGHISSLELTQVNTLVPHFTMGLIISKHLWKTKTAAIKEASRHPFSPAYLSSESTE